MEQEERRVVTAQQKEITKIANRPSKRQRMLTSKRADPISGRPELLYKGEDLRRPR